MRIKLKAGQKLWKCNQRKISTNFFKSFLWHLKVITLPIARKYFLRPVMICLDIALPFLLGFQSSHLLFAEIVWSQTIFSSVLMKSIFWLQISVLYFYRLNGLCSPLLKQKISHNCQKVDFSHYTSRSIEFVQEASEVQKIQWHLQ